MIHGKICSCRSEVLAWRWDKISLPNLELQRLNP